MNRYDFAMDDPTNRRLTDLEADLDASEAEVAARELVPGDVVFQRGRKAIERFETMQSPAKGRRAGSDG